MIHATNNQSLTPDHRPFVEALAEFARRPEVANALAVAHRLASDRLAANTSEAATVEVISIGQFSALPENLGTIRVAVIREGFDGGVERHPNSTQVLLSLEGTGETHVDSAGTWRIDRYGNGPRLEDKWHVVPQGVWHKSAAPGPGNWTVVAFHTASEVKDEYQ